MKIYKIRQRMYFTNGRTKTWTEKIMANSEIEARGNLATENKRWNRNVGKRKGAEVQIGPVGKKVQRKTKSYNNLNQLNKILGG